MNNYPGKQDVSYVHLLIFFVALIPFSASVFTVKSFSVAELVVPLLFGITMLNFSMSSGNVALFQNERGNRIGLFLGLFMFVVVINYIRHPLLPTSLFGGSGDSVGGFKTYYRYMNGLLIFLIIIYWANRKHISAGTVMRMFSWIVVAIVAISLFVRTTGISVPGLDTFKWVGKTTAGTGLSAGSNRLAILEQFGQIGVFLSLSGAALFKSRRWRLVAVIIFLVTIYMGGGRVAMLSTIGGIMVFQLLRRRFLLTGIMASIVILGLVSIQVIHKMSPNAQIARLTDIGSLKDTSLGRYYIYEYGLKQFLENPVFGTGYGKETDIGYIRAGSEYISGAGVDKQLRMGGHTTHVSLLKNLGLTGYIPFIMMWVAPMLALRPVAMRRRPSDALEQSHWRQAQFVIMYFSAMLVRMLVEGNGSDLKFYVYLGIAAVILNEILRTRAVSERIAIAERA